MAAKDWINNFTAHRVPTEQHKMPIVSMQMKENEQFYDLGKN